MPIPNGWPSARPHPLAGAAAAEVRAQAEAAVAASARLGGGWQTSIQPVRGQIGSGALHRSAAVAPPCAVMADKLAGRSRIADTVINASGRHAAFDRTLDDEAAFAAQLEKFDVVAG